MTHTIDSRVLAYNNLLTAARCLEYAINATPTGELRTKMTTVNILLLETINDAQKEYHASP